MSSTGLSVYYAEQKAKIGVIEVAVKPELEVKVPITISDTSIKISNSQIMLLPQTKIRQGDISGVTVSDNIINMRVPTDPIITPKSPRSGVSNHGNGKISQISCTRCLNPLTGRPFTRTLPLPSAAWYEMTDTLICHGSHKTDPCNPRKGDCLVGEQEVWVWWGNLNPSHVYTGSCRDLERHGVGRITASLNCQRCRNLLGRVVYNGDNIEFAVLWKHSIRSPGLGGKGTIHHVEAYIAQQLLDATTQNLCYRFIIMPRERPTSVTHNFTGIRLWMMGGDLVISSSLHSFMDSLVEEVGGKENRSVRAMKVLYTAHGGDPSAGGLWGDADEIQLPLELCLQLWLVLQLSSLTLPPSKRYAQNCRVGYIRYR